MKSKIIKWLSAFKDRQTKKKDKSALVNRIRQLQESFDDTWQQLSEERDSRASERDERIDRERVLKQQVRELEETIAVNKITIENLTTETTRNRERVRAELAMAIRDRKTAIEGDVREQLSESSY